METKRKSAKVVVSLLALAGLAVFSLFAVGGSLQPSAPPGPTMKTLDEVEPRIPITQDDIPLTITDSGSYYLTDDLTSAGIAITVNVNDVTIDLAGFSLIGPGSGGNYGIYITNQSNIQVRNGTVRSFGYHGIYALGTSNANHSVINVRSLDNGRSGIYLVGSGHLVKGCLLSGNNGVYGAIRLDGNGCTVIDNVVSNNQYRGIEIVGASCTVRGNAVYNNQSLGIYSGTYATVTGNNIASNQHWGMSVGNGSMVIGNSISKNWLYGIFAGDSCTVLNNTVVDNNQSDTAGHAGIRAGKGCIVKANNARANLRNNIYLASYGNAVEENLVTGSTFGIYFNSGGNFYANNRASGNTTNNYGGTLPSGGGDGGGNAEF